MGILERISQYPGTDFLLLAISHVVIPSELYVVGHIFWDRNHIKIHWKLLSYY